MKRALIFALALIVFGSLGAEFRVLENSGNRLLIEFRLDEYRVLDQGKYTHIEIAGMAYPTLPGAPLIPDTEIKIGIPPAGMLRAEVISRQEESVMLKKRLQPAPLIRDRNGISEYEYNIDEALYLPAEQSLIQSLDAVVYRGHGFIPLRISPFRLLGGNILRVTKQAIISVQIDGNVNLRNEIRPDQLTDILLGNLINPEQARYWRSETRTQINFADFSAADYWVRLETDRDGMFRINPSQLSSLPLNDIDPRTFRLFTTGGGLASFTIVTPGVEFKEVPIIVAGEDDGNFDPADYIVFYGTSRDGVQKNLSLQSNPTYFNPYSQNTVYWLTFGGSFGNLPLRMQSLPVQSSWTDQTSTHREQFRLETETHRRSQLGFIWFMTRFFGNNTAEYEFQVPLSDVSAGVAQTLTFSLQQEAVNIDTLSHNINVLINGVPVVRDLVSGSITFTWRGTGEYLFNRSVTGFVSGNNTLRIRVIRTLTDNLYLNYITLDHTRGIHKSAGQYLANRHASFPGQDIRYNVSGNLSGATVYRINSFSEVIRVPIQTSGSEQYFVAAGNTSAKFAISTMTELYTPLNISVFNPTDLTNNPPQIDNIIIAPDEYLSQAQNLADLYLSTYNIRSKVVKQNDIFNQFNGGHPDPTAIRQFMRYVYHYYPAPKVTSLTLMGLGTIDWRNFSNQAAAKNKIIVYQRGEIASDDYFAMINSSYYPEIAVGRYPVRNTNELSNMINNYINYTSNPQPGWWRNSMVILGDDLFNGSTGSYENIHSRQVQWAANVINPGVLVDKIFAWEYEYDEFQNKPGARDDMISALNEGRLVWYYIGHGSYDKLGAEDYFDGATDMGRFANPNKLSFFMAASCKVSHFDYWGFESLGQKVVLLNNLGSIASFSATRISSPYYNGPMMERVLKSMVNNRNPVGYAIMDAKINYTPNNDNDATYVLLGDPTLRIIPPQRDSLMTVQVLDTKDGNALQSRQRASVSGSFNPSLIDGVADIRVFDTDTAYSLDSQTHITHRGNTLYKGSITVTGGSYNAGFIVPDDVSTGNSGRIVSYIWDAQNKRDYVNYYHPLALSDQAVAAVNEAPPAINLFLGSYDFREGDTVGTNPTLYARIADDNGINITGSAGRHILLVIDNSLQPIPVTKYFGYDRDSYTMGTLTYPLTGLSEGMHTVQVIAFDNFNLPSVASTSFVIKKTGELYIERLLIYPNPVAKDGNITFILSLDGEVEIGIFTITGKRIRNIKANGRQGFNSIYWDGRDKGGNYPSNNTYFVKVSAKAGNKKTEKTERLVIYK
ncbi:MAG: type IX secretion system sortase PorU [Candidatus Cloacimonadaceae bacterium]|nr:type IX secretion system sortase PorU [Candidatus Cloacimonadaceae bacterium]